MKKLFFVPASLLLMAVFSGCPPQMDSTKVTSITFTSTPSPLSLTVGGATGKVTANVLPATAINQNVTWTVSPSGIVSVNNTTGTVTAIAAGSATITATAQDGSGIKGTCTVTVSPAPAVKVTSITVSSVPSPLELTVGGTTGNVTANVLPATATNKNVAWTISPSGIASVNASGTVTAIAAGNATITATAQDGSGVTGTYSVKVLAAPSIPVTSITITSVPSPLELTVGGTTGNVTANVLPATATIKNVTWTIASSSVATIDVTGTVTPVGEGTTTITATAQDGSGVTGTYSVKVSASSAAFPGTVTFATSQEWTVSGNGITQIWSDAVEATGSNKTDFNGNTADGRNNPGYKGHLFSWYAVDQYKDQLCPAPWRVPTMQDFIDLDIALGGDGSNRYDPSFSSFINSTYLSPTVWGGAYSGICNSDGILDYQGSSVFYWSQSAYSLHDGYYLYLYSSGYISPQGYVYKTNGFTLRCVR